MPDSLGTRGRLIAIRLSEAERKGLDRIAAARLVGLSVLVRGLILSQLEVSGPPTGPCGMLGDVPQGSWSEEFRVLGERAAHLEAHRKRVSGMLANRKVPPGFREWTAEKRAGWLDQHYPIGKQ